MDTEKIGALLRQLRLERGMTQKEAALALQISDKTISKWKRGWDVRTFPCCRPFPHCLGYPSKNCWQGICQHHFWRET